jgi:HD superfamily phosphohydrolase
MSEQDKQIYDPVHGFITITPLMKSIIDTPEFQRLRDLKQLGAVHYVYPSAVHTRFEHSLGVSHLAGIMAESLIKRTSLHNSERIVELVRIAALVHDIGHGPYSHLYDNRIRHPSEPEHEERGCAIFSDMVRKYNLLLSEEEVIMVINMIVPPSHLCNYWLYQIVANKHCQLDVDKIDYIERDCFHTGVKFGGEWGRLLTQCEIKKVEGNLQIAWPKKLEYEIFQLFATRYRLHRQVYNHHTVKAYEYCVAKILSAAKKKGVPFLNMTDSIVTSRLNDEWAELRNKIDCRNIPKLVGEKVLDMSETSEGSQLFPLIVSNLIVEKIQIGFSSGDVNPLENVPLFDKSGKISRIEPDMNLCFPSTHREIIMRWYNTEPLLQEEAIREWEKKYNT